MLGNEFLRKILQCGNIIVVGGKNKRVLWFHVTVVHALSHVFFMEIFYALNKGGIGLALYKPHGLSLLDFV